MLYSSIIKAAICVLGTTASAAAVNARRDDASSCCSANVSYTTDSYRAELITKYLDLWGGNYSLLDQVISPNFQFYQDRLPIGVIPIHNSSALQGWIEHSRGGWSKFVIDPYFWFGSDFQIALRWRLDGVIANVSEHAPGSSLPDGSSVTYNGTDILTLSPCTGLVDNVASAQDFLDYFHNLGLTTIGV